MAERVRTVLVVLAIEHLVPCFVRWAITCSHFIKKAHCALELYWSIAEGQLSPWSLPPLFLENLILELLLRIIVL